MLWLRKCKCSLIVLSFTSCPCVCFCATRGFLFAQKYNPFTQWSTLSYRTAATADRLSQLVEHRTTVRNRLPEEHSGGRVLPSASECSQEHCRVDDDLCIPQTGFYGCYYRHWCYLLLNDCFDNQPARYLSKAGPRTQFSIPRNF